MVKPGDKVKIFLKDEVIEGMYLEKPQLLKQDTIIIKLSNGYNIGIDKDKITSMKVIEEYLIHKKNKKELTFNKKLPTIAILSTGGTISSKVDYNTGGVVADYTAEDFVEMCPELQELANIKAKKIMGIMTEDVSYDDISVMAQEVAKELEDVDGVVLTMGTDTLSYISAALSFALELNKPVIITAAQKSIDRGSSDAFFNLISSVNAAANWNGAEVAVCMHGSSNDEYCNLIKGTKVRKMHSSRRDAFRSINTKEIAKIYGKGEIKLINNDFKKRNKDKIQVLNKFEKKIGLFYIYPNIDPSLLDSYKDYKGLILIGTGLGHVPQSIYDKIKMLIENGVFVAMTTQCLYGKVSGTVYSALRKLSVGLGVVYLEDMLAETALMKLSWMFGQKLDIKEITKNIKGEMNERLEFDDFLR